jgi:hypothetical protein
MTWGTLNADLVTWGKARLTAESGITSRVATRIYADKAPPNFQTPFILFQAFRSGTVRPLGNQSRLLQEIRFDCLAVGAPDDYDTLVELAGLIDQQLDRADGESDELRVYDCIGEAEIGPIEDEDQFLRYGGQYRASVRPI